MEEAAAIAANVPPPAPAADEKDTLMRELWRGAVPAVITLASKEIASTSTPDDIYLMLPRMSYLAAATESCVNYFREYTAIIDKRNADGVWFEFRGIPLKSHLPVGVLFDCHCTDDQLPWRVTLHFTAFPTATVRCGSQALAQKRYFHSLKQGLFMLYGSARLFASLSLQSRVELWEGLCQSNYDMFKGVSDTIVPSKDRMDVKYVPVRCVITSGPSGSPLVVQRPLGVGSARGRTHGTASVKGPPSAEPVADGPSEPPSTGDAPPTVLETGSSSDLHTVGDALRIALANRPHQSYTIKVHGVTVSEGTPLFELWSLFAHSDLFLYIIVAVVTE